MAFPPGAVGEDANFTEAQPGRAIFLLFGSDSARLPNKNLRFSNFP